MKIAIINDTHFGCRNDSSVFLDTFLKFFDTQFFPYLEENNIKNILHLGDLMDRRKYVNFNTLHIIKERFFSKLKDYNFHMVLGNHDTFYRSTNKVNSACELFNSYDFFNLYQTPTTLEFDGLKIGMVPWVCSENENEVFDFLKSCDAPIIAGHFELDGYEVFRGINFSGGMDDGVFSRFEKVLSGHFHIKSTRKNVYYLGSQYEMTFSDLNDMKGFHVLDTETRELEFIENTDRMFYSFGVDSVIPDSLNLKDKMVKLSYSSDDDRGAIDALVKKIEDQNPYDFTIVENFVSGLSEKTNVDLSMDTLSIIRDEIENLELDINKDEIKKLTHEIYMEALDQ